MINQQVELRHFENIFSQHGKKQSDLQIKALRLLIARNNPQLSQAEALCWGKLLTECLRDEEASLEHHLLCGWLFRKLIKQESEMISHEVAALVSDIQQNEGWDLSASLEMYLGLMTPDQIDTLFSTLIPRITTIPGARFLGYSLENIAYRKYLVASHNAIKLIERLNPAQQKIMIETSLLSIKNMKNTETSIEGKIFTAISEILGTLSRQNPEHKSMIISELQKIPRDTEEDAPWQNISQNMNVMGDNRHLISDLYQRVDELNFLLINQRNEPCNLLSAKRNDMLDRFLDIVDTSGRTEAPNTTGLIINIYNHLIESSAEKHSFDQFAITDFKNNIAYCDLPVIQKLMQELLQIFNGSKDVTEVQKLNAYEMLTILCHRLSEEDLKTIVALFLEKFKMSSFLRRTKLGPLFSNDEMLKLLKLMGAAHRGIESSEIGDVMKYVLMPFVYARNELNMFYSIRVLEALASEFSVDQIDQALRVILSEKLPDVSGDHENNPDWIVAMFVLLKAWGPNYSNNQALNIIQYMITLGGKEEFESELQPNPAYEVAFEVYASRKNMFLDHPQTMTLVSIFENYVGDRSVLQRSSVQFMLKLLSKRHSEECRMRVKKILHNILTQTIGGDVYNEQLCMLSPLMEHMDKNMQVAYMGAIMKYAFFERVNEEINPEFYYRAWVKLLPTLDENQINHLLIVLEDKHSRMGLLMKTQLEVSAKAFEHQRLASGMKSRVDGPV